MASIRRISGGAFAGTTLAYWLAGRRTHGGRTGDELRSSGQPVDVEGEAIAVAKRMNILANLRAPASGSTGITFGNGAAGE